MKTIGTLGLAAGLSIAARGWFSLFFIALVAKRVSQGLALALFREGMKAGWFDEAR
jgi:hypothetical protein